MVSYEKEDYLQHKVKENFLQLRDLIIEITEEFIEAVKVRNLSVAKQKAEFLNLIDGTLATRKEQIKARGEPK